MQVCKKFINAFENQQKGILLTDLSTGIAWWTVEGIPLLYELFGLGVARASDV